METTGMVLLESPLGLDLATPNRPNDAAGIVKEKNNRASLEEYLIPLLSSMGADLSQEVRMAIEEEIVKTLGEIRKTITEYL